MSLHPRPVWSIPLLHQDSHLSCNGVEESPPSHPSRQSLSSKDKRPDPQQVFADLEGCNVGFQHFHPTSVTQNGDKLSGQGNLGGAWEWTSSVLEEYDGFKPMDLYPAYTGKCGRSGLLQ